MRYEPSNIRHYQNPAAAQTTAIAQTVGRVRRLDAKTKGCRRDKKRQTEICTNSHAANGFLKCSFLPKLQKTSTKQVCRKSEKIERDFYQSLSQLATHYGIDPMPSKQYGYPYNVSLALDDVQEQLRNQIKDWEEIKLLQDGKKTYLTSEQRYNTGSTLYYIPIVPLYRISKNPKHKQTAQLLQSVCAYLYHIVNIPYYRQESSYLYWMYEMVTEWVLSDDENEDTSTYINEMKQAEWIGAYTEQKIYNHQNLRWFKERLHRFKSKDSFDHDCFLLASKIFELYQQYPNTTIFRNAKANESADQEDREDIIGMEKYISFCADAKGLLFQSLFDSVNNELQECGQMEEPVIIKRFDGNDITNNNLDFENRVFALIEELIYLLNNF